MFRAKRLIRPAFDCHLGIEAEVDEEPEFATRKFEVIVEKLIAEIPRPHYTKNKKKLAKGELIGCGKWIRTTEGVSQQIYSLPSLTA